MRRNLGALLTDIHCDICVGLKQFAGTGCIRIVAVCRGVCLLAHAVQVAENLSNLSAGDGAVALEGAGGRTGHDAGAIPGEDDVGVLAVSR